MTVGIIVTKKQIIKMIEELENNPDDKVRILGDVGVTVIGAGLGAAAAGTVASAVGVTSIPVLTTIGSWIGIPLVAATPIGWIIGVAAAGGVATYGISRLVVPLSLGLLSKVCYPDIFGISFILTCTAPLAPLATRITWSKTDSTHSTSKFTVARIADDSSYRIL